MAVNSGSAARLWRRIPACPEPSPLRFAQDPVLKTRTKEEREEQFNVTHRITMNVQVTDAAGKPVSDLRAENFSLYDNHQARKIVAFHPIDGAGAERCDRGADPAGRGEHTSAGIR